MMSKEMDTKQDKIFSRAFVLVAMQNLLVFIGFQMLITGLPVYLSQLGANAMQIGLMTTLATLGSILCRPFVGALVDRYGRRGFLIAGFAVMALATASYAVFPIVGVILAIRFVHGVAWGFGSTANATVMADILPKKRFGEGMGYFAMTNSLAMALGPAVAMWLVESNHAQLMLVISAGFTVFAIFMAVVMFASAYQQPDLKRDISLGKALAPSNMFERSAIFPSIIIGMLCAGFVCISTFIGVMGAERGIENLSIYFVVYAVVNVVTRPLVGRWIDRTGFLAPGIVSCLFTAVSFVVLAFADSLLMICLAGILVGFGIGTAMSVFNTMAVAVAPPPSRGAATSTYLFFFNGGMAVGSLIGGMIVEPYGYAAMFLVMAVLAVVACLVFLLGGRERISSYHKKQHE